jgi:hypothetical protein
LIYKDIKVIQSSNVTFNVYFHQDQPSLRTIDHKDDDLLKPLIPVGGWEDRVFAASKDIIEWGVMNNVASRIAGSAKVQPANEANSSKSLSPSKSKPQPSTSMLNSTRKILL